MVEGTVDVVEWWLAVVAEGIVDVVVVASMARGAGLVEAGVDGGCCLSPLVR